MQSVIFIVSVSTAAVTGIFLRKPAEKTWNLNSWRMQAFYEILFKISVTAVILRDTINYLLYIDYLFQTPDWRHDLEQILW
jgi:hypothetical protein